MQLVYDESQVQNIKLLVKTVSIIINVCFWLRNGIKFKKP